MAYSDILLPLPLRRMVLFHIVSVVVPVFLIFTCWLTGGASGALDSAEPLLTPVEREESEQHYCEKSFEQGLEDTPKDLGFGLRIQEHRGPPAPSWTSIQQQLEPDTVSSEGFSSKPSLPGRTLASSSLTGKKKIPPPRSSATVSSLRHLRPSAVIPSNIHVHPTPSSMNRGSSSPTGNRVSFVKNPSKTPSSFLLSDVMGDVKSELKKTCRMATAAARADPFSPNSNEQSPTDIDWDRSLEKASPVSSSSRGSPRSSPRGGAPMSEAEKIFLNFFDDLVRLEEELQDQQERPGHTKASKEKLIQENRQEILEVWKTALDKLHNVEVNMERLVSQEGKTGGSAGASGASSSTDEKTTASEPQSLSTTSPYIEKHRFWVLLSMAGIFSLYNVNDGQEDALITQEITYAMSRHPGDVSVSSLLGGWRASFSGVLQVLACSIYERVEKKMSPQQQAKWFPRIAAMSGVLSGGLMVVAYAIQNNPRYADDPEKYENQPFLTLYAQNAMFVTYWLNYWGSDFFAGFLNPLAINFAKFLFHKRESALQAQALSRFIMGVKFCASMSVMLASRLNPSQWALNLLVTDLILLAGAFRFSFYSAPGRILKETVTAKGVLVDHLKTPGAVGEGHGISSASTLASPLLSPSDKINPTSSNDGDSDNEGTSSSKSPNDAEQRQERRQRHWMARASDNTREAIARSNTSKKDGGSAGEIVISEEEKAVMREQSLKMLEDMMLEMVKAAEEIEREDILTNSSSGNGGKSNGGVGSFASEFSVEACKRRAGLMDQIQIENKSKNHPTTTSAAAAAQQEQDEEEDLVSLTNPSFERQHSDTSTTTIENHPSEKPNPPLPQKSLQAPEIPQHYLFLQWAFQAFATSSQAVYGAVALKQCALDSGKVDPAMVDAALTMIPLVGGVIGSFIVMPCIVGRVNKKLARRKLKLEAMRLVSEKKRMMRKMWRRLQRSMMILGVENRRWQKKVTEEMREVCAERPVCEESSSSSSAPRRGIFQTKPLTENAENAEECRRIQTACQNLRTISIESDDRSRPRTRSSTLATASHHPSHSNHQVQEDDVDSIYSSSDIAWDAVFLRAVPQTLQFIMSNLFFILLSTDSSGQTLTNRLVMGLAARDPTGTSSSSFLDPNLGTTTTAASPGNGFDSHDIDIHPNSINLAGTQLPLESINSFVTLTVLAANMVVGGLQGSLTQPSTMQSVHSQGRFSQLDSTCTFLVGPYLVGYMTTSDMFRNIPIIGSTAAGEQGAMEATLKACSWCYLMSATINLYSSGLLGYVKNRVMDRFCGCLRRRKSNIPPGDYGDIPGDLSDVQGDLSDVRGDSSDGTRMWGEGGKRALLARGK